MSCNGEFDNGEQVVKKIRMMGFSEGALPISHTLTCECGETIEMDTFEYKCPHCSMVYGVTPCSSHDVSKIKKAGINF